MYHHFQALMLLEAVNASTSLHNFLSWHTQSAPGLLWPPHDSHGIPRARGPQRPSRGVGRDARPAWPPASDPMGLKQCPRFAPSPR